MQAIVLMDFGRLDSFKGVKTFLSKDGERFWMEPERAFKFVVTSDDYLVVGPFLDHGELYAVFSTWALPITESLALFKKFQDLGGTETINRFGSRPVIGAGTISADGRIAGWKSDGFRIETPDSMRADITALVAQLHENGALALP